MVSSARAVGRFQTAYGVGFSGCAAQFGYSCANTLAMDHDVAARLEEMSFLPIQTRSALAKQD
jgi:hypothetical protein